MIDYTGLLPVILDGPYIIKSNPGVLSGKLTVAGHRITLSQLLTDLAEGMSIKWWADDYDIPEEEVAGAIQQLANVLFRVENKLTTERPDSA